MRMRGWRLLGQECVGGKGALQASAATKKKFSTADRSSSGGSHSSSVIGGKARENNCLGLELDMQREGSVVYMFPGQVNQSC